jgi:ribosomal protein S18 acetylase RimI-like enzyme
LASPSSAHISSPSDDPPLRRQHSVDVRRIVELATPDFAALLAESERAGFGLLRRLWDEWQTGANRFDRPGEALFGASIGAALVGVGGLNVDPYTTAEGVGRVRHLYVREAYRGRGIGEHLVVAIVEAARGRFDSLRLRTSNPEAARLYERLGFRPSTTVPHCTHIMNLSVTIGSP